MYAGFSYYIYSLKKMPQPEIRSTISVLIKLKIFFKVFQKNFLYKFMVSVCSLLGSTLVLAALN